VREIASADEIIVADEGNLIELSDSDYKPDSIYDDEEKFTKENLVKVSKNLETLTIKNHTTMMSVAFKIYGDYRMWRELSALNPSISPEEGLSPGMKITFRPPKKKFVWKPKGKKYFILEGDTLGKVSKKAYNSSKYWKNIWINNGPLIRDPDLIFTGFTLYYEEPKAVKKRQPASIKKK